MPVTVTDGLDPVMPLIISDSTPLEESPHSDTQEAGGTLSLAEPPTTVWSDFPLPTPFPLDKQEDSEPSLYQELTQTPRPTPTEDTQTEAVSLAADPEVLPGLDEDVGAVQSENDTTTFSAATVLSGDGEAEPPSYPRLLDTDSELDYHYDSADAFLPVS